MSLFRQLDLGTISLKSFAPGEVGGMGLSALWPTDIGMMDGCALTVMQNGKMVETWVLFSTYQAPHLDPQGNGSGFMVRSVAPSVLMPGFIPTLTKPLPTPDEFVAAVLARRNDRSTCVVIRADCNVIDPEGPVFP